MIRLKPEYLVKVLQNGINELTMNNWLVLSVVSVLPMMSSLVIFRRDSRQGHYFCVKARS